MEGRWVVWAEPCMSALQLTDGTPQEWERPASVLPGVPGNVIKHSADPLAVGIWAPPGPPAHPDPHLAVLTGSCQERRPALLARPVGMSSSAANPAGKGPAPGRGGGRGSGAESPRSQAGSSLVLIRSPQQETRRWGATLPLHGEL